MVLVSISHSQLFGCSADSEIGWLPKSQPGNFLYIRPTIIGNGEELGVQVPAEVMLFVIAVPWPDLSTGQKPGAPPKAPGLKLLASKDDIRAWPGGFGYTKVSANYGPAFLSHMEGRKRGYDQILWLFGEDFQVTEAGASNFFVVWKTKEGKTELVTAPLTDKIILDGVTRRSVLELARERVAAGSKDLQAGIEPLDVVERKFSMLEIEEAWKEGRLVEAFVAGTAVGCPPSDFCSSLMCHSISSPLFLQSTSRIPRLKFRCRKVTAANTLLYSRTGCMRSCMARCNIHGELSSTRKSKYSDVKLHYLRLELHS